MTNQKIDWLKLQGSEAYRQDLDYLVAANDTLLDESGASVFGAWGPQPRVADDLPDVKRLREEILARYLPPAGLTVREILDTLDQYVATFGTLEGSGIADPSAHVRHLCQVLESQGLDIRLAVGPMTAKPRAYLYVRDSSRFLTQNIIFMLSAPLLDSDKYFWIS